MLREAAGRVHPGPAASPPGRSRRGRCAVSSGPARGRRASACRRVGPGLSACAGLNKTRSPPCMRCRGPRLASPHQGQPVAWPSRRGRAARQSQEPALGSGCPAPPTSRSHPRAVPVSNGESISTCSARDSARPGPHLFLAFFLSTLCPQNMAGYPHSTGGFPPPFTQVIHRLPGVTRWNAKLIAHGNALFQQAFLIRSPRFRGDRLRLSGEIRPAFSRGSRGTWPGRARALTSMRPAMRR